MFYAPFRECVVLSLRSKRFCAEDRGFLSEAGQFPFGKPLSGDPGIFCSRVLSVFLLAVLLLEVSFSCRFSFLSYFYWCLSFPVQGVVCVFTATMGRIFGPAKGMSSTTLPYKRRAPSWIRLRPEDLSEQFYKLERKGITPSSIGVTLGDSFDVAQVEMFSSIKFLRFLKKKGLAPFIPEDLYFLVEKDVSMQLSIEEPVEPDCMKYGVSSTEAVFRLHVRELVWSWLDTEARLRIVATGTLYFKQDWTLAHLRPCTCCLSSSQWSLICRTTSPCPGTSRCLLLLPLQVAPQFRVGHLDPLSAGWLTICIAPARRPGWSVRCIRVATGRSRI